MIMLCDELSKRLDSVWYRLQRLEHRIPGMSQLDLDEACIARLEKTVTYFEAEATNSGYNKLTNGWIGS